MSLKRILIPDEFAPEPGEVPPPLDNLAMTFTRVDVRNKIHLDSGIPQPKTDMSNHIYPESMLSITEELFQRGSFTHQLIQLKCTHRNDAEMNDKNVSIHVFTTHFMGCYAIHEQFGMEV